MSGEFSMAKMWMKRIVILISVPLVICFFVSSAYLSFYITNHDSLDIDIFWSSFEYLSYNSWKISLLVCISVMVSRDALKMREHSLKNRNKGL